MAVEPVMLQMALIRGYSMTAENSPNVIYYIEWYSQLYLNIKPNSRRFEFGLHVFNSKYWIGI
jgi:hypothetical protein